MKNLQSPILNIGLQDLPPLEQLQKTKNNRKQTQKLSKIQKSKEKFRSKSNLNQIANQHFQQSQLLQVLNFQQRPFNETVTSLPDLTVETIRSKGQCSILKDIEQRTEHVHQIIDLISGHDPVFFLANKPFTPSVIFRPELQFPFKATIQGQGYQQVIRE
ncbi:hypothetical protein SS50377_26771 [Spironucleus salmonicida]|uniref:Uncharacterized protein n=1 Tax=Spironucleus salmonicida TaxID=348837 RepID=V6LXG8_9EUKA|nr:hypothetical protein SS50377_26771 [Spironucleus salmonicida]|eukprot:EST49240.1 Hypothetical protein SS50377_10460 [Spironucleus salmonicida]